MGGGVGVAAGGRRAVPCRAVPCSAVPCRAKPSPKQLSLFVSNVEGRDADNRELRAAVHDARCFRAMHSGRFCKRRAAAACSTAAAATTGDWPAVLHDVVYGSAKNSGVWYCM